MECFPPTFNFQMMKREEPNIEQYKTKMNEIRGKIVDIANQAYKEGGQFVYFFIGFNYDVRRVSNREQLVLESQKSYDAYVTMENRIPLMISYNLILKKLGAELVANWGYYFTTLHETNWDTCFRFFIVEGSPDRPKELRSDIEYDKVANGGLPCSGKCRIEFPLT